MSDIRSFSSLHSDLFPPADVAAKYQGYLKGGMTATGFVRTDPKLAWPADLQTRLPQ